LQLFGSARHFLMGCRGILPFQSKILTFSGLSQILIGWHPLRSVRTHLLFLIHDYYGCGLFLVYNKVLDDNFSMNRVYKDSVE